MTQNRINIRKGDKEQSGKTKTPIAANRLLKTFVSTQF